MNPETKQKTGRLCVEAFKRAARQLTAPVGRFESMIHAESILGFTILQLPLVDFDPLTAEVMEDHSSVGVNGEPNGFAAPVSGGRDVITESARRSDKGKYHLHRSSRGAHPAASSKISTPAAVPSSEASYAADVDKTRPKVNRGAEGNDQKNNKASHRRKMSTGPAKGLSGDSPMEQLAEGQPGKQQAKGQPGSRVISPGAESVNGSAQPRHAHSGNPSQPMIRQLNDLSDALLGRSGPAARFRSNDDYPSPPLPIDNNGHAAHFADPPNQRTHKGVHVQSGNTVATREREERLSSHSRERAQALLKSQQKTDRPDENRAHAGGGSSNEQRRLVNNQRRRITKTVNVLKALAGDCVDGAKEAISPVHGHRQQKSGTAIQPAVLSHGPNSGRVANSPENPRAHHAAVRALDESPTNGGPPHDGRMAAEQLTDMINDVLVSQARRHGVDL